MCVTKTVPVAAYKWLVCFLLEKSHKRLEQLKAEGKDEFDARNNSQVTHMHMCMHTHTHTHTMDLEDFEEQYDGTVYL